MKKYEEYFCSCIYLVYIVYVMKKFIVRHEETLYCIHSIYSTRNCERLWICIVTIVEYVCYFFLHKIDKIDMKRKEITKNDEPQKQTNVKNWRFTRTTFAKKKDDCERRGNNPNDFRLQWILWTSSELVERILNRMKSRDEIIKVKDIS